MKRLSDLPLLLLLTGIFCLSMLVPAGYALSLEDHHDARSFFYSALMGLIFVSFIAVARAGAPHNRSALRQLAALLVAFVLLPAILAVPFYEAVRNTTFLNAYVEMVSSLTTTGATLFEPARLSGAEHLWRAQVGWMGGLLMWIAAAAILAPLTLGGFEVTAAAEPGQGTTQRVALMSTASPAKRLTRAAMGLVPVYVGLTLTLWVMLTVSGNSPLVGLCHAMSVMATSGISPVGGLQNGAGGIGAELVVFFFLFFALSRLTFSNDAVNSSRPGLRYDPEFRLGLLIVISVPVLLFLRHWLGALDVNDQENSVAALRAFWGSLFTVMSYMTTTGFESADWTQAQAWSGLNTPGVILMGLAIIGGGVATTAGGVKLLRIFALYLNGLREVEKLVHPSSVGRAGGFNQRIRKQGAFIAWVFFMLFAVTQAFYTVAFTAFGISFENASVLAIAALSTTGPLINSAAENPIALIELPQAAKLIFSTGMILGRLELLAILALITPEIWRT